MKRTIELTYANNKKINKGDYNQDAPMFCQKVVIQTEGEIDVNSEYKKLRDEVDQQMQTYIDETKLNDAHFRLLNGVKYPTVTVINSVFKKPFDCDAEYGIRGQEIEKMCIEYLHTNKWPEPSIKLMKIKYEDIKYKQFFEKFGELIVGIEDFKKEIYNDDIIYSGEIDMIAELKINEKTVNCIVDFKTGQYDLTQLVAYSYGNEIDVEGVCVFDLKNCKIDYLSTLDVKYDKLWTEFLIKRGAYKERYGI